jgi:radical SAM protein with 4Fe4S-binding SPASM domain
MSKIRLLAEVGYPLDGISITMNDLNIDYIDDDFITSLKELGFTGIATDIDLVNSKNCNKNVDFYVDKLMSIYLTCEKLGIDNFGSWSSVYSNLVNQENEDPITYCKAQSGENISVNPEGNVFLCGYSSSSIGNINQFDELFVENGPFYNLINSRLPGKNPRCKGCKLEGICSGQCLVTNEFNESKKIDFMCEFFIKATTRLLEHKLEKEKKLI